MSKNFMKNGKWIDNPNTIKVTLCTCGNKYIKTRPQQKQCLRCMAQVKETLLGR